MNAPLPLRPQIRVEIVHDFVCPWCCLGQHRLARALAGRPDLSVEIVWQPFLLNPDLPRAGLPRADYAVRKFGGEERARRLEASITAIGRAEGVVFAFERIRRIPSTLAAHRLLAAATGVADVLARAIYAAHFTQGRDIGDAETLVALAIDAGMEAAAARAALAADPGGSAIHGETLRAHQIGISGVPCFVIGGRFAIAGAQEKEVLERLLDLAAIEASAGLRFGDAALVSA